LEDIKKRREEPERSGIGEIRKIRKIREIRDIGVIRKRRRDEREFLLCLRFPLTR